MNDKDCWDCIDYGLGYDEGACKGCYGTDDKPNFSVYPRSTVNLDEVNAKLDAIMNHFGITV